MALVHLNQPACVSFQKILEQSQLSEVSSFPNLPSHVIDHSSHQISIQAEHNDFRMPKRMQKPNRVNESRSLLIGIDHDKMPAKLRNVVDDLLVRLVGHLPLFHVTENSQLAP